MLRPHRKQRQSWLPSCLLSPTPELCKTVCSLTPVILCFLLQSCIRYWGFLPIFFLHLMFVFRCLFLESLQIGKIGLFPYLSEFILVGGKKGHSSHLEPVFYHEDSGQNAIMWCWVGSRSSLERPVKRTEEALCWNTSCLLTFEWRKYVRRGSG